MPPVGVMLNEVCPPNGAIVPIEGKTILLYGDEGLGDAIFYCRYVPLLAAHFLRRYAARYRKAAKEFSPDAMELLLRHSWPGNVRELDHAVERAMLMAEGGRVEAHDFGLGGGAGGDGAAALDQMSLEEVERVLIQKALTRAAGNVSEAAKALGLSRSALYRRLKRHGL